MEVSCLAVILLIAVISAGEAARILAVLAFPGKSHLVIIQPILEALSDAGHDVVFYTPMPKGRPIPSYTEVVLGMEPFQQSGEKSIEKMIELPPWKFIDCMFLVSNHVLPKFFQNKKVKELIHSNEHFDLVITESFFGQEFTLLFGHIFKAPTAVIHTFATTSHINMNIANVLSLSSVPDCCSQSTDDMNLLERLTNVLCVLRGLYLYYHHHVPAVESAMGQYFPGLPSLQEMMDNVSLVFTNDHPTSDYSQPRTPYMIPVAGIHIQKEQNLPPDLQAFIDGAEHGLVLLSMGSVIPEKSKPKEYFETFVKVFKSLRQRVLWKTQKEAIEGLPTNVMTVKWLPQRDVLAHHKCVLHITHGGMASLQESVYTGVPTVTIPYLGDQYRNAGYYRAKGVGVVICKGQLSEDTLSAAITEVIGNPKYKENMVRLSGVFRDRPRSHAEEVVFWTEHVLRHRGAPRLRTSPSSIIHWYQLVLGLVVAVAVIVIGVSLWLARVVVSALQRVRTIRTVRRRKTE